MKRKNKTQTIDIEGSSEGYFNPEKHTLVRRNGRWIPVDKQLVRWRKFHKKPAEDKAQDERVEDTIRNLFRKS